MKLSIITVNLNNRDGLQKTIDSVISQTFKDFEWIVIDGGSTDGSRELIEQYADHFAYWVSEPDKGIYNAMNKGIRVAKGDYLQFLNSGDWLWDTDVLKVLFSDEHLNVDADILYGKSLIHDTNGYQFEYGPHHDPFSPFALISAPISHPSTFTQKDLFEKVGLFDEAYRIAGDLDFFFRAIILNHAKTHYIDRTITHFSGGGISMTNPQLAEEEKKIIITKYMLHDCVYDYLQYLALQKCDTMLNEKRKAIAVYENLHKHWITRKIMHTLYRLIK